MASTYSAASRVLAWLGPAADNSDLAMRVVGVYMKEELVIERNGKTYSENKINDMDSCEDTYKALIKLYSRP
jgi:hypothetical protein